MSEEVLGTPLFAAEDDDREITLLLSDLHVPHDGGPALAMLEALLAHARTRAARTRVMILGDLFDAYVGPRQLRRGAVRAVAEALRATADAGVSVSLLHGNRDFMLERRFATATACRVVPGGLRFRLGHRDALALHGDELCQQDLPYQRSKRILRAGASRWLLRNLPLAAAEALARKARRASMRSVARGDQERFHPTAAAVSAAFARGVDLLVFGHIHRPARGRLPEGGEYCILPAYDEGGVHLRHQGDLLRYQRLEGGEAVAVPDPGARTFP